MGFYQLRKEQYIPSSLGEVWEFISSPANLKKITPEYMGFDIVTKDLPAKMYAGMIIEYKVRPVLGLPMTWVTEITHVAEQDFFIDEQRMGPYALWHHQHILRPAEGGVLMVDIVSYRPPFGFLGTIANTLLIRKKLEGIFSHREHVLRGIFPERKPQA